MRVIFGAHAYLHVRVRVVRSSWEFREMIASLMSVDGLTNENWRKTTVWCNWRMFKPCNRMSFLNNFLQVLVDKSLPIFPTRASVMLTGKNLPKMLSELCRAESHFGVVMTGLVSSFSRSSLCSRSVLINRALEGARRSRWIPMLWPFYSVLSLISWLSTSWMFFCCMYLRQDVWFYSRELQLVTVEVCRRSGQTPFFAGFSLLGLGRHLPVLYSVLYRYACSQSCDSHTDNFIYCLIILITCTVFLWMRSSVNGASFLALHVDLPLLLLLS